jgi:hypothetical protein
VDTGAAAFARAQKLADSYAAEAEAGLRESGAAATGQRASASPRPNPGDESVDPAAVANNLVQQAYRAWLAQAALTQRDMVTLLLK